MPSLTPKSPSNRQDRRSLSHSGRSLILVAGTVFTLLLGALSLSRPAFVSNLDGRFFDDLISQTPPPPGYLGPVVIALDDEALARFAEARAMSKVRS